MRRFWRWLFGSPNVLFVPGKGEGPVVFPTAFANWTAEINDRAALAQAAAEGGRDA